MNVKMLDADADKEEIKQYSVRGYPTILFTVNGGKPIEYPGERTAQSVIEHLNTM
jgi:thiol:disulfide interchange protein